MISLQEQIWQKQGEIKAFEDWLQKHHTGCSVEQKEVKQKLNLANLELLQLRDELKIKSCEKRGHGGC